MCQRSAPNVPALRAEYASAPRRMWMSGKNRSPNDLASTAAQRLRPRSSNEWARLTNFSRIHSTTCASGMHRSVTQTPASTNIDLAINSRGDPKTHPRGIAETGNSAPTTRSAAARPRTGRSNRLSRSIRRGPQPLASGRTPPARRVDDRAGDGRRDRLEAFRRSTRR